MTNTSTNRRDFAKMIAAGLGVSASVSAVFRAGRAQAAEMDETMAFYARPASDRGLRFLRSVQGRDGAWAGGLLQTAMALRAFVSSYQRYNPNDGPFITKPLSILVDRLSDHNAALSGTLPLEEVAQTVRALRALNLGDQEAMVASAQAWIAANGPDAKQAGPVAFQTETFLALTALRGYRTDSARDLRAASYDAIAAMQLPSGGFPGADGSESFALTCVSAGSLAAALQRRDDGVLATALSRVEETYTPVPSPSDPVFLLFEALPVAMLTVERLAAEGAASASSNWRDTMAYELLQTQADDGGWLPDGSAADRVVATARAVNALNRALA